MIGDDGTTHSFLDLFGRALSASGDGLFLLDLQGGILAVEGFPDRAGLDGSVGRHWPTLFTPEDREAAALAVQVAALGQDAVMGGRIDEATGRHRTLSASLVPLCGADGGPERLLAVCRDVTEQRRAGSAADQRHRLLQALIEATAEMVWHYDVDDGTCSRQGWPEFTGLDIPPDAVHDWLHSVHPDDQEAVRDRIAAAAADCRPFTVQYRLRHRSGAWRRVLDRAVPLIGPDGRVTDWIGFASDVEDQRANEERIWKAAHTDDLTGLANRLQFQSALQAAVSAATADGGRAGIVLVDLDRFKEINDTFGHDAGDRLLRSVGDRIAESLPAGATLARLGGDEFGIVLGPDSADAIMAWADAALAALRLPVDLGGFTIECTATVGYAEFPKDADSSSVLLKAADLALYAAKAAGRGRAVPYRTAMLADHEHRITVLRHAREALARDAIIPFYQPKVSLRTGEVTGFEALLRWHDGLQLRPPAGIMHAFSDADLSTRLGNAIRARVIADMTAWRQDGIAFGHVAVNLAAPEFQQPGLVDGILQALDRASLPANALEVEVTESVLLDAEGRAVSTAMADLHEAGVAISLDDFGTGYASLTHLKRHPIAWLKIDRSFVSNLETDKDSRAIVRAVIGMARNIGIKVVAEGVETSWQATALGRMGCDAIQGYLVAKPMAASRVPRFLEDFGQSGLTHRVETPRAFGTSG